MSVSTKNCRIAFSLLSLLFISSTKVHSEIPRPDHVVICVLENHAYQQIIGSPAAPYINQLASIGANMVEKPSATQNEYRSIQRLATILDR